MSNIDEFRRDPRASSAILVGTSQYKSEAFPNLPVVVNNITGLKEVFTDPSIGFVLPDMCSTLVDPDQSSLVSRAVRRAASTANFLLFYFAGHGIVDRRGNLYLGLTQTDPDDLATSALPFPTGRDP